MVVKISRILLSAALAIPLAVAQQNPPSDATPDSAKQASPKKDKKQAAPTASPEESPQSRPPAEPPKSDPGEAADKEEHYDVAEVPPVITHHQFPASGKSLAYTATTGRLPLKRADGKIEAEMFFVAYTLDGPPPARAR
jgi:carboxypeptidase C (cathepsin A)